MGENSHDRRCGHCRSFRNDRAYLEASMPGLLSMGSGDSSVRADDGICLRRDLYLSARASCGDFTPLGTLRTEMTERPRAIGSETWEPDLFKS